MIDCGRRSEGKTSCNEPTSRNVHCIRTVSISFLEVGREGTRKIY